MLRSCVNPGCLGFGATICVTGDPEHGNGPSPPVAFRLVKTIAVVSTPRNPGLTCCAVKEARRLRSIHIVSLAWLEDSLLTKSRRPLNPVKYEFEQKKITKSIIRRRVERKADDGEENGDRNGLIDVDEEAGGGGAPSESKAAGTGQRLASVKQKKRKREDLDGSDGSKDERVETSGMLTL